MLLASGLRVNRLTAARETVPGQAYNLSIQFLYGYLALALGLTGALVMAMSLADKPETSGLVGFGESRSRCETGCGPLTDTFSGDDAPDFELDIVPILAAAGCNSASCHGAAAGQAGFRLSLFCGDPDFDYDQIVRELGGRRIHRTRPKESLLLLKATQTLEHGGDERFDTASRSYRIIRSWIAQGAQRGGDWDVERIDAETSDIQREESGASCQLQIIATLRHRSSGETTYRDVTEWSVLESFDESAFAIEGSSVRLLRPGRGFILARFANRVTTIALDLPWGESLDPSAFLQGNWVDVVIYRGMARMGLEPAAEAAPHVVARRLNWDLAGRIASPERIQQWLEGAWDDERYAAVVDELLSSPEFESLWSYHLANWMRASTMGNDPRELDPYFGWIQQVVRDDRSLVDVMRDTLHAEGPLSQNPAVGFYR
ncbi:MAG TPA: DUF1549 domain-containing protein, partial [Pirellulaceae bacterium]|nr:DUF1549 domain-containing protein [Pirellulaceae bacterium]